MPFAFRPFAAGTNPGTFLWNWNQGTGFGEVCYINFLLIVIIFFYIYRIPQYCSICSNCSMVLYIYNIVVITCEKRAKKAISE